MTRINTNVGSLIAQTTLSRSNSDLSTSLTRLSTGLRINSGKDDPSGLIASEVLRSDIRAVEKAISNTDRANLMIATADSALGQVSKLLTDIRGLIVETSNDGVLSEEQVRANQLQVDSSLEAINRISQMTKFQGRRLLDGSLDFITDIDSVASVQDLQVDQASLGAAGAISVDVDVIKAATQATITNNAPVSTNANATATLQFSPEAILTGFNDTDTSILVRATEPGASLEGVTVQFTADSTAVGSEVAVYDSAAKTLTVHVNDTAATTAGNVINAINQLNEFEAVNTGSGDADVINGSLAGDVAITDTTDADEIVITAANAGPNFNNLEIRVQASSAVAAGAPTAAYDEVANTLTLTVHDDDNTTLANAATAIDNLVQFSATASSGNGDDNIRGDSADVRATANTGTTGGGVLLDTLAFKLGGSLGAEAFTFESGASVNHIVNAVNLVADSTGVRAFHNNGALSFYSERYGSRGFVDIEVISEGSAGTFQSNLSDSYVKGTDIHALINGVTASGDGNSFSINTSNLDVSLTVNPGSTDDFDFTISGGGALFQLGPDVVTNQQARLGIQSVNTASLGGVSGRLYELASGGPRSLSTDPTGAANIITEVIDQVTTLRGRLGAFQKSTLETNLASLNDTLANLTEAESLIRDADFAAESSALTRSQILVQSGTQVLAIANSTPQNVLALLG